MLHVNTGWIRYALTKVYHIGFYKDIYHLLFDRNLNDINDNILICQLSHRQFRLTYEGDRDYNVQPVLQWKYDNFVNVVNKTAKLSENFVNTFVIIGDSIFEFKAAQELKEYTIPDSIILSLIYTFESVKYKTPPYPNSGVLDSDNKDHHHQLLNR